MPLPPEHVMERLSISYLTAVAAMAGVNCRPCALPEYGTDAHLVAVIRLPNGKYADTGYIINCQIKATTTSRVDGSEIVYDMDVGDYNKLASWQGGTCILVLFCLPQESADWLSLTEEELVLKRCCYWKRITDPPSNNARSKRIFIPRSQVFTPRAIVDLLEDIRREAD